MFCLCHGGRCGRGGCIHRRLFLLQCAQAEIHMVKLDWAGAIDRLLAAQTLARSSRLTQDEHIEAAIVDSRLRPAQLLRREQLQER